MRSLIVLVLPLLLLTGCGSKPSFEGKWVGEIPAKDGRPKVSITNEMKADGKLEFTAVPEGGKEDKMPGKWTKTGDKTADLILDREPKNPAKAELIDDKTLEIADPDTKSKIKFTKK